MIAVSRPKTVMNHGIPAAKSGRRYSPVRMRKSRQVGDRAVERAAQALPAAADSRDAQRPGGDDVADGLALVVEQLDGLDLVLEPRQHVDAHAPALVRLERERERHRVPIEPARFREDEPSAQIAPRIDDRDLASPFVVRDRRRRRKLQRELGVAEREVVMLHGDDVREVCFGLERDVDLEPLGALVAERDALLHSGADEALARDRDGVTWKAVRGAVPEVEPGPESARRDRTRGGAERVPPTRAARAVRGSVCRARRSPLVSVAMSPRSSQMQKVDPSRIVSIRCR